MLKPLDKHSSISFRWFILLTLCVFSHAVYAGQELRSERVVVVQPGETLSEIVEREMRSAVHWPAVARHNNIQDVTSIAVGQTIRIPQTFTRSNEHAIVLFVKGSAERRAVNRNRDTRLSRGDEIRVGDEILTGPYGFVSVQFSSGSTINVQPDSHISVVDLACEEVDTNCIIELYAEKGGVQSRVNNRPNQPVKFKIETPSGSAAVRGTVFDIDTSSAKSATAVTRGNVDMFAEGVIASVDGGFGVLTPAGSVPGVPWLLLDPPTMKELPVRLAKGDMVYWWGNNEAASYNVAISKDLEATTVESSDSTIETAFAIPIALHGSHYISIRSVDAQGLKGMPTAIPVELVSALPSTKVPVVLGELIGSKAAFTLLEGVGPNALLYEIQLADNPRFDQSESYDIAVGQGAVLALPESRELWSRARAVFADFKVSKYSEVVRVSR